jgi:hypothetical protein
MYDNIAANTTNDYTRAQMDYLAGQAYLTSGRPAEAHARYKHAVENYPLSYHSYLGLVGLLDAGVAVGDLDRGLTDYFAGVYDKALGRSIATLQQCRGRWNGPLLSAAA